MANLVKLYTRHGAIMIDTAELHHRMTTESTRCLHIYTTRGNLLMDTAAYLRASPLNRPSGIVHPANLFATPELAKADSDRIFADMRARATNQECAVTA